MKAQYLIKGCVSLMIIYQTCLFAGSNEMKITGREKREPLNKNQYVLFINNELFITDSSNQVTGKLFETAAKIMDFSISPGKKMIAFEKEIGQVEDSGDFDDTEDVPLVSVCSIVLYDIENHSIMKEIFPEKYDFFIRIYSWPGDYFLSFVSCGFFDVSGIYVYDVKQDTVIDLNYDFDRLSEFE